jgi:hypothetical protein
MSASGTIVGCLTQARRETGRKSATRRDKAHSSRESHSSRLSRALRHFPTNFHDSYGVDDRDRLILLRIHDVEARRSTGCQQLYVGAHNGQPQGLEFQRQRQM